MAMIRIHRSGEILREKKGVSTYLKQQKVHYESWRVERIDGHLKESYRLSPDEQQAIIEFYSPEIADLKSRQGYITQDMVMLSDLTPNLDSILEKFRREHHLFGMIIREDISSILLTLEASIFKS